jgi:hypothetical protein
VDATERRTSSGRWTDGRAADSGGLTTPREEVIDILALVVFLLLAASRTPAPGPVTPSLSEISDA